MKGKPGVSVFITLIILAFVLTLVLGMSALALRGARITYSLGNSVNALRAADTGVERWLYAYFEGGSNTLECADSQENPPCLSNYPDGGEYPFDNGASYQIYIRSTSMPVKIRSVGHYRDVRRALEISF